MIYIECDHSWRLLKPPHNHQFHDLSASHDSNLVRFLTSDVDNLGIPETFTEIDTVGPTKHSGQVKIDPYVFSNNKRRRRIRPIEFSFLFTSQQVPDDIFAVGYFSKHSPFSVGLIKLHLQADRFSQSSKDSMDVFDMHSYKLIGQVIRPLKENSERLIAFQSSAFIFVMVSIEVPQGFLLQVEGWHLAQYNVIKNSVKHVQLNVKEYLVDGVEYNGKLYFIRRKIEKGDFVSDLMDSDHLVCLDPSKEFTCSIIDIEPGPKINLQLNLDKCRDSLYIGLETESGFSMHCLSLVTFRWSTVTLPHRLMHLEETLFHVVPRTNKAYLYGQRVHPHQTSRHLYELTLGGVPSLQSTVFGYLKKSFPKAFLQCQKKYRFQI